MNSETQPKIQPKTQPKIQPYRWVQNVFSLFGNGGIEVIVGTTSNCDRYHGLTELIEKHFLELTVRRRGLKPKQTWIGFTSSEGETLALTLEDYMSQERP